MSRPHSKKRNLVSPAGLASLACVFASAHWALHLADWRQFTAFLSGTIVGQNASLSVLRGALYLGSYFGWVLGTPILLGAALLMFIATRCSRNKAEDLHSE